MLLYTDKHFLSTFSRQGTKLESWVSKVYKILGQGWKYNMKEEKKEKSITDIICIQHYGRHPLVHNFKQAGPSGRYITMVKTEMSK